MSIAIRSAAEIDAMRAGGGMLATVLQILKSQAVGGMTPRDASAIARAELRGLGGEPAFLGFHGYPDVICISVNNQVQHSIPTDIPFQPGDIVNFDFGVRYKGMITDGGITVCIDERYTTDTKRLVTGTAQALERGLQAVRAGGHVGDISAAIEQTLRKHKLGIVRELVGHGVGKQLHEEPEIPNYGQAGTGAVLRAGMTVAIEPITTLGNHAIRQAHDGWTLYTVDKSWSAQFEHTVVVTPTGCEVLTRV